MESPFYEMTHDYETENKIATSSYNNGYANGKALFPPVILCSQYFAIKNIISHPENYQYHHHRH